MLSETTTPAFAPCPAPFNMAAHVLGQADELSTKIALEIIGGAAPERWSYGALKAAVLGVGAGLLELGAITGRQSADAAGQYR